MGAYNSLLPVQFSDLYLQVRESEFNYDQMCEAMSIMEGTHNFKSFCTARGHFHYGKEEGTDKYISVRRREEEFIKTMFQIKVEPVGSPLPKLPQFQHFKFYNIRINGNAFLHNQIRRMVGAGLCVCEGRLKLDSISRMLAYPDDGYHNKARPAEPHGLFLADVKYTEQSMQGATHEYNHMPVQPLEEDVNMYVVGQHLQGATDGLSQPIDNFVDDA